MKLDNKRTSALKASSNIRNTFNAQGKKRDESSQRAVRLCPSRFFKKINLAKYGYNDKLSQKDAEIALYNCVKEYGYENTLAKAKYLYRFTLTYHARDIHWLIDNESTLSEIKPATMFVYAPAYEPYDDPEPEPEPVTVSVPEPVSVPPPPPVVVPAPPSPPVVVPAPVAVPIMPRHLLKIVLGKFGYINHETLSANEAQIALYKCVKRYGFDATLERMKCFFNILTKYKDNPSYMAKYVAYERDIDWLNKYKPVLSELVRDADTDADDDTDNTDKTRTYKRPREPEVHLSPFGYCGLLNKTASDAKKAMWNAINDLGYDLTYAKIAFLVEVNVQRPAYFAVYIRDLLWMKKIKDLI